MYLIPRKKLNLDIDSLEQDVNIDFEDHSPHQEGVISEIYQKQNKSYFQEPPELQSQVDRSKLVQKFLLLLKWGDIDKILKIIQRKVLKGTCNL